MSSSMPGCPASALSFVLLLPPSMRLRTLIGRIQEGVVAPRTPVPPILPKLQFDPIPARLAEVEEVAESGLLRSHKKQVVIVLTEEVVGAPVKRAPSLLRIPTSNVRETTCLSGGSLTSAFGKLHGSLGSAQPSSIDVGARLASL